MNNQVNQRRLRFILAFRWISLTASGWTIGKFFSLFAIVATSFPLRNLDIGFALSGFVVGGILGFLQLHVLKRVNRNQFRGWVKSSALGYLIGGGLSISVISTINNYYLSSIIHGAIVGTVVSSMQWHLLRRWMPNPRRWILANTISWATAEFIVWATHYYSGYHLSFLGDFTRYGVVTLLVSPRLILAALIGASIIGSATWFSLGVANSLLAISDSDI